MTSVLGSFFRPSSSEYAAVAPQSPEADATFINSISYGSGGLGVATGSDCGGLQTYPDTSRCRSKQQMSRSSYSNSDFHHDGSPAISSSDAAATKAGWNDAAIVVGQWTSTAANVVAASILSTGKHLSTQLGSNAAALGAGQATKRDSKGIAKTQPHSVKSYGRGIDRDYLQGSPYHPDVANQSTIAATIGDLATRFTAPKVQADKPKWW